MAEPEELRKIASLLYSSKDELFFAQCMGVEGIMADLRHGDRCQYCGKAEPVTRSECRCTSMIAIREMQRPLRRYQ
jgi:hypothetical protein